MIAVLGLGNLLLKDDGLGIHALHELEKIPNLQKVVLYEVGCALLDLLEVVERQEYLIIIDAVRAGGAPGTVYRLAAQDIEVARPPQFGLHELGLAEVLQLIKHRGKQPYVSVFGIEPEQVGYGLELSATVSKALPKLIKEVHAEINQRLDHRPCS